MTEKNKVEEAGKKIEDFGKKTQQLGCLLTVLITIPILLTVFLGIPGLIIGSIIAILGIVGQFKKK